MGGGVKRSLSERPSDFKKKEQSRQSKEKKKLHRNVHHWAGRGHFKDT